MFVANYGPDVGYAWSTIASVYRDAGERLAGRGVPVAMCFANLIDGAADGFRHSPVEVLEKDYMRLRRSVRGSLEFARFLRHHGVRVLYLTDQPSLSWRYVLFRLSGVRRIVIHDRTSGERTHPGWIALLAKRALHAIRWATADTFVAVSNFVADRLEKINGIPHRRIFTVHNGIDLSQFDDPDPAYLRRQVPVDTARKIVFFAGRARVYKGVDVLIRALARLKERGDPPLLVVCGDGVDLPAFKQLARVLDLESDTVFLGRRDDVERLLPGAAVAVVPSVWAEAFGLSVVEALAAGVPVVASRVGGIPELVEEGRTGLLVPPGDPEALAAALEQLLRNGGERHAMGQEARRTARARFDIGRTVEGVARILEDEVREARLIPAMNLRSGESSHG